MIRILIAEDHAIVRAGLKQIVRSTPDMVVAGEAAQGSEVLDRLRAESVDLLLLEISMHGISGVDLIRRIRAERPMLPVLVLTIYNEPSVVFRALRAGATGYITKESDPEVLLAAIRKLVGGGRFIDPKLADMMVFVAHSGDAPTHELLSNREFQVLQMFATGKSINEIAATFILSAKTISTHKMRLMKNSA